MKDENQKRVWRSYLMRGTVVFMVVAASIIFAFLVFKFRSVAHYCGVLFRVLQPVIFGFVIAYLVSPMVSFFEKNLLKLFSRKKPAGKGLQKTAKGIAVFTGLLIFVLIIALCFYLIIPEFIVCINDLIKKIPDEVEAWGESINKMLKSGSKLAVAINDVLDFSQKWFADDFTPRIKDWIAGLSWSNSVVSGVGAVANAVGAVVVFLKNFGIGLIISIYLLYNKTKYQQQARKIVYAVFKKDFSGSVLRAARKTHLVFNGFINGKLLDSLIIGLLCFIGVTVLRIPYSMLVSVVIGVTNIIPVFGPYIGGIPCAILVFLVNPIKGLYFAVFVILLQMLDGNFIGPKILGDKTGLESFWVVFAIVVGGGLFGVVGMLVGVPTFAVIYYLVALGVDCLLRKKQLPRQSSFYTADVVERLEQPQTVEDGEEQP